MTAAAASAAAGLAAAGSAYLLRMPSFVDQLPAKTKPATSQPFWSAPTTLGCSDADPPSRRRRIRHCVRLTPAQVIPVSGSRPSTIELVPGPSIKTKSGSDGAPPTITEGCRSSIGNVSGSGRRTSLDLDMANGNVQSVHAAQGITLGPI